MKKYLLKVCAASLTLALLFGAAALVAGERDEPGPIGQTTITTNLA